MVFCMSMQFYWKKMLAHGFNVMEFGQLLRCNPNIGQMLLIISGNKDCVRTVAFVINLE